MIQAISEHFIDRYNDVAAIAHANAIDKGFWKPGVDRNDGEMIALFHSELSEALEAIRHGNPPSDKIPEFSGAEEELADLIIRIMDTGMARGWRIPEAIIAKMEFNAGRPFMHGKAF